MTPALYQTEPDNRVWPNEPTAVQSACLRALHRTWQGYEYSWARSVVLELLARRQRGLCGVCRAPVDRRLRFGLQVATMALKRPEVGPRAIRWENVYLAHLECSANGLTIHYEQGFKVT